MAAKFQLGDKVQDSVSDFIGTATARFEYLNGCVRYQVEAPHKREGVLELVFDEQRLELYSERETEPASRQTGGAVPSPPRTGVR